MGLTNLFLKPRLRFLCDVFNINNNEYDSCPDQLLINIANGYGIPLISFSNLSLTEKKVCLTMMKLPMIIMTNNRNEFRKFSDYTLHQACNGRFEILCFIAVHEGQSHLISEYSNNALHLRSLLTFIYKFISTHAPNAITLSYEEYYNEAVQSLKRLQ
ncbi:MAG: hypothetical protein WCI71_19990 [Bacteroidota bacterium]